MSVIKVESGVGILGTIHTGAGSGAKSELPPSSSKTESSIMESSMINESKQVEHDGAQWGEKRSPSQASMLKQTNDAMVQCQRTDQSSSGMLKPEKDKERSKRGEKRENTRRGSCCFFARGSRE